MPTGKPLHILLVDDDAVDRELFVDALHANQPEVLITEAANGQEAISFLQSTTRFPDLIFLDLNMPVKDGRETLREIRNSEALRGIPVCILSTSNAHFEVTNAYQSGANLFMVKPFAFGELTDMLQSLLELVRKFVKLPDLDAVR